VSVSSGGDRPGLYEENGSDLERGGEAEGAIGVRKQGTLLDLQASSCKREGRSVPYES
jgi:hypothetical protein